MRKHYYLGLVRPQHFPEISDLKLFGRFWTLTRFATEKLLLALRIEPGVAPITSDSNNMIHSSIKPL